MYRVYRGFAFLESDMFGMWAVDNPLARNSARYILMEEFSLGRALPQGRIISPSNIISNMKWLHIIAWILVIVGALNWGLVGVGGFMGANWNLVNLIFGSVPMLEWIVYVLVGLAGVYELVMHKKNCTVCGGSSSSAMM